MEVYYNGEWGTVCDDGWDLNDAEIVCRQLSLGTAIAARDNAFYEQGSGQIWLDEINCIGTELTIEDCSHNGWGIQDCSHGKDAGVQCAISNGNFSLSYIHSKLITKTVEIDVLKSNKVNRKEVPSIIDNRTYM